ncbi:MAG: DUF3887 domain-containing protein [Microcystaceae cyanobacterium]
MILARFLPFTIYSLFFTALGVGTTLAFATPGQTQSLTPKTAIAQTLTESQRQAITEKAKAYLTLISKGDFAQARTLLAPDLQKEWSDDRLKALWQRDLVEQFGPVQKFLDSSVIDIINGDIVKLTVKFEKGQQDFLLTFNKQQALIAANWTSGKSIDYLVEEFFDALQNKDYAKARTYLSPLLKAEIFPDRIQKRWESIIAKNGDLRKVLDVDVKPANILDAPDVAIATLKFTRGVQEFFIFFDRNRAIMNVDFPQN